MAIWEVVKNLQVDLSQADLQTVIKNMEPKDWEQVKTELLALKQENLDRKRVIDITIAVIDTFIDLV